MRRDRHRKKFAGASFNEEPDVKDLPLPTIPKEYTIKKTTQQKETEEINGTKKKKGSVGGVGGTKNEK